MAHYRHHSFYVTLRSVREGIDAAAHLNALLPQKAELLRRKSGMKGDHFQEMLAVITGINRGTVNGYCNHKRLGSKNLHRIADALEVSVIELGAPLSESDARGLLLAQVLRENTRAIRALTQDPEVAQGLDAMLAELDRLLDSEEDGGSGEDARDQHS